MKTKQTFFQVWLLGASLLALPAVVHAQFTYTTSGGVVTITGYTGSDNDVTIPSIISGLPVTKIGNFAFNSSSITNVTIPNSVTYIGSYAFQYCIGLTSVTIPNSVTYIDFDAFEHCAGLISITLGNHLNYIEEDAFALCESLTSIAIPDSVTNLGQAAFGDCISLSNVTIGNGLTSIEILEFDDCTSLTNVTIGTNVTNIGGDAFLFCNLLPSFVIPDSVTNIDSGAFTECESLIAFKVNAANPAYSSMSGVLFNKNKTTLIAYPDGLSGNYSIPNNVTSIGDDAFNGSSDLTGVTIPNSVTNIGEAAFYGCTSLTNIVIPNTVTTIGDAAFSGSSLTSVTIPRLITSIEDQTFFGCFNLTAIYFQSNAPTAGVQIFLNAPGIVYYPAGTTGWSTTYGGLPTIMLGSKGQTPGIIDSGVKLSEFGFSFNGISNQVIVVEASTNLSNWQPIQTNTLGGTAFNFADAQWRNYSRRFYRIVLAVPPVAQVPFIWITNDGAITITGYTGSGGEITLPSVITGRPVTRIGDRAFSDKSNLGTITIPATITNIGSEAFDLCINLGAFTVNAANPAYSSWDGVLFDKNKTTLVTLPEGRTGSYTIPSGVTTIGDYAIESVYLNSVTIPNSVTSIGDYAFLACGNLTELYFQGNAPILEGPNVFFSTSATVYYLAGTTGWSSTYGGLTTMLTTP
jgi:BspA type Leucine rich repeat region (6 copies)